LKLPERRLTIIGRFKGFKVVFNGYDVALARLLTEDTVSGLKISIMLRNIVAGLVFV
jgi:hypothetical protein